MKNLFNPQIFFLYNNKSQIKKTFFLTYKNDEELKKTKEYQLFIFYQNKFPEIFFDKDYKIINDHILLTLTVGEIRGYIQKKILKTDLKILVFSLWDNVDYSIKNNLVFNPFENNQLYKEVSNETIIYEIYKNIFTTAIFCVIDEENYFNKNLCSNGVYNHNISIFTNEILSQDLDEITEINLIYEKNKNLQYNIDWSENILYDIKSIDFYKKNINEYYYDNYFISGDELILMNNENEVKILKENSYTNVIIYDNDINDEFININNNIIYINDISKYKNLIYIFPNIEKIIIKKKIFKEKYKIEFNINIKSKLVIFYENNFFIFETKKTKNIFLDRSKKINIMVSKNHIFFNGYNLNFELCIYLTKLIIGYQIQKKNADFILSNKKAGSRYYSRYCQTIKKPSVIEDFNPNDLNYNNINDIYFEHLNGGNDVYYDIEKQKYVTCLNSDLSNISFINELYQGYNICLPCCYKKKKNKTVIFNKCIEGNIIKDENSKNMIEIIFEPYIHIFKNYRTIMDQNKIGALLNKSKNLFNENTELFFFNKKKIKYFNFSDMYNDEETNIKIIKEKKILNKLLLIKKKYNFNKMKSDNIFVEKTFNIDYVKKNDEENINIDKLNVFDDELNLDNKDLYLELFNIKNEEKINSEDLTKLLESFKQYIFINKNKRVLLAKNYIVYMASKNKKTINNLKEILDDEELSIYIFNDSFFFNPKILKVFYKNKDFFIKNVKFFLIIKNVVHILKSISKIKKMDNLIIEDIPFDLKKKILEKYFYTEDFIFKKEQDNIIFSNQGFFIDQNEIKNSSKTKYLYSTQRINLNKYSIGYYIVNILYKNYFLNFYYLNDKDEILFKKTFLSNLSTILNKNIIFDKMFIFDVYKSIILDVIKLLNPKFINEKELKKYA